MSENLHLNQRPTCGSHDIQVITNFPFWQMLTKDIRQNKKRKLSKPEAFCDLLNRQRIAALAGDDKPIDCGILALSESWGWQRQTVGVFLDKLQDLGLLSIQSDGYRKTIRLHLFRGSEAAETSKNSIQSSDGQRAVWLESHQNDDEKSRHTVE